MAETRYGGEHLQKSRDNYASPEGIKEASERNYEEMLAWRNDFHENPELGGQEVRTAEKIKEYLGAMGIEIIGENIGLGSGEKGERLWGKGTGIVAIIRGEGTGPTIALRADMDALPIKERSENNPRSQKEGLMHGCGHDLHATALLGAAEILQQMTKENKLPGNVLLIFQPSEEKAHQKESGAVQMIKFLEQKGLRNSIKAFFGLHVMRELPRGTINLKTETQMASSGEAEITLRTGGGHIMNAYELPNLNEINSEINVRLAKIFKPMAQNKKGLIASGSTHYNSSGYNVLASESKGTWVIRITSPEYKKIAQESLAQIKATVAEVLEEYSDLGKVDVQVKWRPGYRPVVHRDAGVVKIAEQSAQECLGNFHNVQETMMGGEDFSFYLEEFRDQQIPGAFVMVGGANPEKGYPKGPHHAPDFKVDPEVLKELSALYADISLNALKHFNNKK